MICFHLISLCSIPPRSTENSLYDKGGGGAGRGFLSQDLNPGSDSAALGETKTGEDLTDTQGDGQRTEHPPAL